MSGNIVDTVARHGYIVDMTRHSTLSPAFLAAVQERHRRNWNRLVERDEAEARTVEATAIARRSTFKVVR